MGSIYYSWSGGKRYFGDTVRYTSCGYHCFQQCVLKVRIRDGVIVSCEPDDTINPGIPREDGYLPEELIDRGMIQTRACAKGYTQARMIYDPRRVKYPMKRVGKRGEAAFERISWDEALDTIARKLVEIKAKYGPFSILHHPYSSLGACRFPSHRGLARGSWAGIPTRLMAGRSRKTGCWEKKWRKR